MLYSGYCAYAESLVRRHECLLESCCEIIELYVGFA